MSYFAGINYVKKGTGNFLDAGKKYVPSPSLT